MNIGAVQKAIDAGKLDIKGTLDHDALKGAGLARGGKDGVRLLGKGELKTKLASRSPACQGRARSGREGGRFDRADRAQEPGRTGRGQEGQGPREEAC